MRSSFERCVIVENADGSDLMWSDVRRRFVRLVKVVMLLGSDCASGGRRPNVEARIRQVHQGDVRRVREPLLWDLLDVLQVRRAEPTFAFTAFVDFFSDML